MTTRKTGQFAVGQAEYATGHVLKTDKSIYQQDGEIYLLFDSQLQAMEYMVNTVAEHPNIECWMEDSLGEHVITLDENGERIFKRD